MIIEARLNPKQDDAMSVLTDHTVEELLFGGGAGGGKSWLGCTWLAIMCSTYPGVRYYIGRDELKKIMATTYLTFQKVCKMLKIPLEAWKLNSQYNYIEWWNGSRIDLLDLRHLPSDPMFERLGSYEFTGGWNEETGEIAFAAVDVLKSRIGRHKNDEYRLPRKMLHTGNPSKNWTYSMFYRPAKEGKLPASRAFIQSLVDDNPKNESDYKRALQSITDPVQRARLLLGDWEFDNDPTALMPYDALLDLFTNNIEESNERYITCDAARFGGDRITVGIWDGWKCTQQLSRTRQGIDQTAEWLRQLMTQYSVPRSHVAVDEVGVGGGIVDLLPGIIGFVANAAAYSTFKVHPISGEKEEIKQNYANLKAQCGYRFAERVNRRGVSLICSDPNLRQTIIEELGQVKRAKPDADAKLALLSKDRIKEVLGRSPDFADMLIMRELFEVRHPDVEKPTTMYHQNPIGGIPWEHIE